MQDRVVRMGVSDLGAHSVPVGGTALLLRSTAFYQSYRFVSFKKWPSRRRGRLNALAAVEPPLGEGRLLLRRRFQAVRHRFNAGPDLPRPVRQPIAPGTLAEMPTACGCRGSAGGGRIAGRGLPNVVIEKQADSTAIEHRRMQIDLRGGPPVFQFGGKHARAVVKQVVANEKCVERGIDCDERIAVFTGHGEKST